MVLTTDSLTVGDSIDRPSISIDAFLDWYPEDSEFRYELRRGVIITMPKPKGKHSELSGELALSFGMLIREANLSYFIPKECVVKTAEDTGYEPDVIILDRAEIASEPRWNKASTVENSASIKLIIEVVSSNWRDDYLTKFADYEAIGVQEYWIVDYAGLGGRRFIGMPKQPTLTVCSLVDGEYELRLFRGEETIVSSLFPNFPLTAHQVLTLAQ
jgi:Uma2 family endonuclease